MADKNKTKIETLNLNFNTKTSQQSKIQSSAKITKLVIAKCVRQEVYTKPRFLYNLHSCCKLEDLFRVCSAGVSLLVIQLLINLIWISMD